MPYLSQGEKNGAQIPGSYIIDSPIVMYKYIEENRGEEISGSTAGVVSEWMIHNVAYDVGHSLTRIGFQRVGSNLMAKGETLDIGSTIFDDSHGALSYCMWLFYGLTSPFSAAYDLMVEIFE